MASARNTLGVTRAEQERVLRAVRRDHMTIPAFPNAFPYNELLLDGKLIAKTRNWVWRHRGLTLLYTSTKVERLCADAYGLDPKTYPKKVLVGVGELVDSRVLDKNETLTLLGQFNNLEPGQVRKRFRVGRLSRDFPEYSCWQADGFDGRYIEPFPIGFFFRNLTRFKTPVPFDWPPGPVKPIGVPVSKVAAALKAAGIREINGVHF